MTARKLSMRMGRLDEASAITDILALAARPEVVSFAGGLPDPACIDVAAIAKVTERMLAEHGAAAFNYGPAQGDAELRGRIAARMATHYGVSRSAEDIQVTSGGAEALLLVCMALVDPGDVVLVGAPTYLVALHVLRALGARIVSVPLDEHGLSTAGLQQRLDELRQAGESPRLLYTVPSFQNPTGRTQPVERRRELLAMAERYDLTVVEDHAYGDLRFEGEDLPTLASLAPDRVIFLHTFSKIVAPGLRLGWVAADRSFVAGLGLCKVATDSCASTLGQRIVRGLFDDDAVEAAIVRARAHYRAKRDALLAALERHAPAGVSWNRPQGGFYVWLDLGNAADSDALLRTAITEHDVAFVAGSPFFDGDGGARFARLAYSFVAREAIDEGVRRLARVMGAV